MRVAYESLLTRDQWDYHWKMAALQIKDTVEKKGREATLALPSNSCWTFHGWGTRVRSPPGHGSPSPRTCWTAAISDPWRRPDDPIAVTSEVLEALCWRGELTRALALAVGAVLLGNQMAE